MMRSVLVILVLCFCFQVCTWREQNLNQRTQVRELRSADIGAGEVAYIYPATANPILTLLSQLFDDKMTFGDNRLSFFDDNKYRVLYKNSGLFLRLYIDLFFSCTSPSPRPGNEDSPSKETVEAFVIDVVKSVTSEPKTFSSRETTSLVISGLMKMFMAAKSRTDFTGKDEVCYLLKGAFQREEVEAVLRAINDTGLLKMNKGLDILEEVLRTNNGFDILDPVQKPPDIVDPDIGRLLKFFIKNMDLLKPHSSNVDVLMDETSPQKEDDTNLHSANARASRKAASFQISNILLRTLLFFISLFLFLILGEFFENPAKIVEIKCSFFHLQMIIRIISLKSGDIELNPGPVDLTQWLRKVYGDINCWIHNSDRVQWRKIGKTDPRNTPGVDREALKNLIRADLPLCPESLVPESHKSEFRLLQNYLQTDVEPDQAELTRAVDFREIMVKIQSLNEVWMSVPVSSRSHLLSHLNQQNFQFLQDISYLNRPENHGVVTSDKAGPKFLTIQTDLTFQSNGNQGQTQTSDSSCQTLDTDKMRAGLSCQPAEAETAAQPTTEDWFMQGQSLEECMDDFFDMDGIDVTNDVNFDDTESALNDFIDECFM